MAISTFEQIETLFAAKQVDVLYVKFLAKQQDNEKNQIVLGEGDQKTGVLNLFPAKLRPGTPSTSTKKKWSEDGRLKTVGDLDLRWFDENGNTFAAPNAKIIEYFQYSKTGEPRLSGFLKNCVKAPDALRRKLQHNYGQRILVLGFNHTGTTYGLVVTEKTDPLVNQFPDLPQHNSIPLLHTHVIGNALDTKPSIALFDELKAYSGIWHPSKTLKIRDAQPTPFKGNQGAGFTLEALLNIPRNCSKKPDKYGHEIKSFKRGGKITLMTPTPDLGFQGDLSFREFMKKYSWGGKKNDRQVFTGTYRFRKPNASRGYYLDIEGFCDKTGTFSNNESLLTTTLLDRDGQNIVAGWSYKKLLKSWGRKHAAACYVEYERRPSKNKLLHDYDYLYTGRIFHCETTTIHHYLNSIAQDHVFYEPAHEIKHNGKAKVRPQWRIYAGKTKLPKILEGLYASVKSISLLEDVTLEKL